MVALVTAVVVAGLAFAKGGADPGWARPLLTGLLVLAAGAAARSARAAWPWALLGLAAIPYAQTIPIPVWLWARLSGARAEALAALESIGATPRASLSIDAATTLEAAALAAGAFAVFCLVRTGARAPLAAAGIVSVVGCVAVAQAVMGAEQYAAALVGEGGEVLAHGSFVSRGHLAAFLEGSLGALLGLAAAAFAHHHRHAVTVGVCALAAAGAAAAGIVLSLSRAGFVALGLELIAALWLLVPRFRRVAAAVAVLLLLAGVSVAPDAARRLEGRFAELEQGRDQGRVAIWNDSLPLVAENAVAGVGLGAYPYAFRRSAPYLVRKSVENAHNDYLELPAELGVPAFVVLAGALLVAFGRAGRGLRALEAPEKALATGCLIGAGAMLAHAAVDFPLRLPATALLVALLLGVAWGLAAPHTRATRDRASRRYATVGVAAALAALVWFQPVIRPSLETQFAEAEEAYTASDPSARARFVRLLEGNPFVAPAWLRLAAIARGDGDEAEALRLTRMAYRMEPDTLRTSWPLAEAELFLGDRDEGFALLTRMAEAAPDLRPTAYRLAWRAGVAFDEIEAKLTAPEPYAAGEYLAFLARTDNWERIPGAYGRLGTTLDESHRDYLRGALEGSARAAELTRLEELGFE